MKQRAYMFLVGITLGAFVAGVFYQWYFYEQQKPRPIRPLPSNPDTNYRSYPADYSMTEVLVGSSHAIIVAKVIGEISSKGIGSVPAR